MTPADRTLLAAARRARRAAHAPYSTFRVGAAVRADDGRVFAGCNVENASYGLTMCAERVAIGAAVAAGARRLEAVAVVGEGAPRPCGACRQVMAEFMPGDAAVLAGGPRAADPVATFRLDDLLPERFSLAEDASGAKAGTGRPARG